MPVTEERVRRMGSPVISVIVPVYNVQTYLERCVRSIQAQTLAEIEILLIDDGSTDQSGAMCDAYAAQDSRIRVIHKANGGLSDARNAGIDVASAEYVGFIDSDDYIAEDMYETLYNDLRAEDADVAVCGICHCYSNEIRYAADTTSRFVVDAQEIIRMILDSSKISVNAVNKLYKKSLFDDMRFPVGKQSEDAFLMVRLLSQIRRGVVNVAPKYYYVHRTGSITTHSYRPADHHVIEAYEQNFRFVEENYPSLRKEAEFRRFWAYFYVLDKALYSDTAEAIAAKREISRFLRKNALTILKNPFFGRSRKIATLLLLIHLGLYRRVVTLYDKKKRQLVS